MKNEFKVGDKVWFCYPNGEIITDWDGTVTEVNPNRDKSVQVRFYNRDQNYAHTPYFVNDECLIHQFKQTNFKQTKSTEMTPILQDFFTPGLRITTTTQK